MGWVPRAESVPGCITAWPLCLPDRGSEEGDSSTAAEAGQEGRQVHHHGEWPPPAFLPLPLASGRVGSGEREQGEEWAEAGSQQQPLHQVIAEDISGNNCYVELSFQARNLDDKVRPPQSLPLQSWCWAGT